MVVFLVLSLLYVVGWGVMFDSPTFRWTFVQWRFFSAVISLSVALIFISFLLGIVCRVNFGRGLPRYRKLIHIVQKYLADRTTLLISVNAEEPLAGDDYPSTDAEKIDFPSNARPIPTFSAAFGSGSEVPPPSQMRFGPRQQMVLGPRFSDTTSEPFETQSQLDVSINGTSPISSPPVSLAPSYYHSNITVGVGSGNGLGLDRSNSRSTMMSFGYSASASESGHSGSGWSGSGSSQESHARLNNTYGNGSRNGELTSNGGGAGDLMRSNSRGSSKSSKSTASAERARWVIE